MEDLFIKGINDEESNVITPDINAYSDQGLIEISGWAYGYYSDEHFSSLFEWMEQYCELPQRRLTINFKMGYFNTTYSKRFVEVMRVLEDYQENRKGNVIVNWYYEEDDLDMREEGEEYQKDIDIDINLVAY